MIGTSRLCAYQPERPPTAQPASTSVLGASSTDDDRPRQMDARRRVNASAAMARPISDNAPGSGTDPGARWTVITPGF